MRRPLALALGVLVAGGVLTAADRYKLIELGVRVLDGRVAAHHGGLAVRVAAPGLDEVGRS